jgi:hypothetical protein
MSAARPGFCEGVDYHLTVSEVSEFEAPKSAEPFSLGVEDRVWIYQSIEEGTEPAQRPNASQPAVRHLDVEVDASRLFQVSYCWTRQPNIIVDAPHWIDTALFPRTREAFRRIEEERPRPHSISKSEPDKVYYFGHVGLQK